MNVLLIKREDGHRFLHGAADRLGLVPTLLRDDCLTDGGRDARHGHGGYGKTKEQ